MYKVYVCKELRATKNCVWRKSYPSRLLVCIFCVEYFSGVDVINNEPFDYHMKGHVPTLLQN